jgi:hypothetical protein
MFKINNVKSNELKEYYKTIKKLREKTSIKK